MTLLEFLKDLWMKLTKLRDEHRRRLLFASLAVYFPAALLLAYIVLEKPSGNNPWVNAVYWTSVLVLAMLTLIGLICSVMGMDSQTPEERKQIHPALYANPRRWFWKHLILAIVLGGFWVSVWFFDVIPTIPGMYDWPDWVQLSSIMAFGICFGLVLGFWVIVCIGRAAFGFYYMRRPTALYNKTPQSVGV
jgi:hypothetical protein